MKSWRSAAAVLLWASSLAAAQDGTKSIHDAKDTFWYFDAETALRMARETGRPIFIAKVRADGVGGTRVKT